MIVKMHAKRYAKIHVKLHAAMRAPAVEATHEECGIAKR